MQDLTFWNRLLLDGVAAEQLPPPLVARALALLNGAAFDVVNAAQGSPYAGYALQAQPHQWTGVDLSVALARSAGLVLADVFQGRAYASTVAETVQRSLMGELPTAASHLGQALGQQVAQALLALRAGDRNLLGSTTYAPPDPNATDVPAAGAYQPTGPGFPKPASLPDWGAADPWIAGSLRVSNPGSNPVIPALPSLTSSAYAEAFQQVKQLGSAKSELRTNDQSQIAMFWANGVGTETPPGHWQTALATIAEQQQLNLLNTTRLYAAAGFALADAGMTAWRVKYDPAFWRPVTAIQQADRDGNSDTQADPFWQPLISTPPFPAFPSGHSTFSAAAATVAAELLGDAQMFTLQGGNQRQISRSYTSLMQAAEESGMSRIYGGIHFAFDNLTGLAMGQAIGRNVLDQALMEQVWLPDGGASYRYGLAGATARSVQGGGGHDRITGAFDQGNRLWGNAGDDLLIGGSHDDWLIGGTGVDQLFGLGGSDLLIAGSGGSRLVGSGGDEADEVDRLVGGTGRDHFVFSGSEAGLSYSSTSSYAWIKGFDLTQDCVEIRDHSSPDSASSYRLGLAPQSLGVDAPMDSWLYRGSDTIARFDGISLQQWGFSTMAGGSLVDHPHLTVFQWV
ncbi:phosphatase PAP2 family protein [Synechococcus sp. HJ21-Hayes]|uniref:phosphatase PAP2 family protein n=1 Tax=Synechococcus sp. HJ21-Hayes TaxID=2823736 RepID=UPI0020CBF429|nr:phosphatase PAP2 family protein [Synechococcus sp. HJ21-Hayes]